MLRLRPFSFVDRACHPEIAGTRRMGTSIKSIMAVTYLSHDQSRLVTYVTDCYAKVGPTSILVQQSWTNFICWSNKKLDGQLAALLYSLNHTIQVLHLTVYQYNSLHIYSIDGSPDDYHKFTNKNSFCNSMILPEMGSLLFFQSIDNGSNGYYTQPVGNFPVYSL